VLRERKENAEKPKRRKKEKTKKRGQGGEITRRGRGERE
jgi:hypothetical protein